MTTSDSIATLQNDTTITNFGYLAMRLFLAIELPENLRKVLYESLEPVRLRVPEVRWEPVEKLHLTLIFLGEIAEERLADLETAVRLGAAGVGLFKLSLGDVGFFPNERQPRVVWVGVKGEVDPLLRLEPQLGRALETAGFAFDQKKFHPHVTLGRVKDHLNNFPLVALPEMREFEVGEVVIMKSTLQSSGSVYTPLVRVALSAK